jgi:hypothetical protein
VIHGVLQELAASVIAQVSPLFTKLDALEKADPDKQKDVASALDLSRIRSLIKINQKTGSVAVKSSRMAIDQVDEDAATYDTVDTAALRWAAERSANLVGQRYDANGRLVPAKRAKYRIDDSTRTMLRSTLGQAVDDGLSVGQLRDKLSNDYAFSLDRSLVIARTELGEAHIQGAMIGYREAMKETGKELKKIWLLGEDPCDECQANADEGPIPIDEPFQSGDDAPLAHPNCRCDVAMEEAEDEEAE